MNIVLLEPQWEQADLVLKALQDAFAGYSVRAFDTFEDFLTFFDDATHDIACIITEDTLPLLQLEEDHDACLRSLQSKFPSLTRWNEEGVVQMLVRLCEDRRVQIPIIVYTLSEKEWARIPEELIKTSSSSRVTYVEKEVEYESLVTSVRQAIQIQD